MKNGTIIRQIVNKLNEIDFNASEDRHTFGDIYEGLLRDLQSAGNYGEFYTPRAQKLKTFFCGELFFTACLSVNS